MKKLLIALMLAVSFVSCHQLSKETATSKWTDDSLWYESEASVNPAFADVFYLVSTEVLDSKDSLGVDSYISKLTPADRVAIKAEMDYARGMFGDSLNFFSPYYSQFTLSSMSLSADSVALIRAKASADALDAFRYYIRNLNGGRPFILAGFSQGSMHLLDVVRNMEASDYERLIVSYCMGYRVSAEDLSHPQIRAAESAHDRGVIVSFNSVTTPDAIWPAVSADAACCINPINYCTDSTPAEFEFRGDALTVHVDTQHQVLIVEGENVASYRFPVLEAFCKPGNLHHWDLLFYGDAIRHNAQHRAYSQR